MSSDAKVTKQQDLIQAIVDHLPAAVAVFEGRELRARIVNPAYQAFAPAKEMVGRTFEEIWPELRPEIADILRRVLQTGTPYSTTEDMHRIRRAPDASLDEAWFTWSVFRIRLPEDQGWAVLNIAWEVTTRKKTDEQLRESEQQLRMLVNSLPQLCWMARADGYIYWYNERWYEYTGTTPDEMAGWGWQSVHDPQVLPSVMERWERSIKNGTPFEMVFPLRGRRGNFRSFLTRVVPLKNSGGMVLRWFGTNTDIDELRKAQDRLCESEAKLRLHQERLRLTRSAAKVASWEYDVEREQFDWSPEVFDMFHGITLGTGLKDFMAVMRYSADRDSALKMLQQSGTRKKHYEFEFRLVADDGEVRLISARGRPFYNQGESLILGMFIELHDDKRPHAERSRKQLRLSRKSKTRVK